MCLATSIFFRCLSRPFPHPAAPSSFSFFRRATSHPFLPFNFVPLCMYPFAFSLSKPASHDRKKTGSYRHTDECNASALSLSLSLSLCFSFVVQDASLGEFLEDYKAYAKLATTGGFARSQKRFTACNSLAVIETDITRARSRSVCLNSTRVYFCLLRFHTLCFVILLFSYPPLRSMCLVNVRSHEELN